MKNNQSQTVAKGFTILSIAGIFSKLLALIYVPVLTMIIGNEGNGIYNVAFQIYTLMFVITNTGVPIAIAKFISELRALEKYKDAHTVFIISRSLVAIIGIVVAIIMGLLAKELSGVFKSPRSYLSILALTPTIIITSLASSYRGYFQGNGNMTPTAVSQIIEQFFNAIFTIIFAYLWMKKSIQWGSAGATVGTTVGALASFVYLYIRYKKDQSYTYFNKSKRTLSFKKILRKIIDYSVPITLGALGTSLGFMVDASNTLRRLYAAGFVEKEAQALYGILTTQYQKLLSIPIVLAISLGTAIIPAIAVAMAQKDKVMLKRKINEAFRLILIITIPAAFGLAVLAQPILNLLFSYRYNQGAGLLMIGSSALVFMSIVQIQTSVLQSIGKMYVPPITMLIGMLIKVIINYQLIAIPQINIVGAVIGTIISYLFIVGINFLMIKKYTFWIPKKQIFIKPIMSSFIMGIVVFIVYHLFYKIFSWILPSIYLSNLIATFTSIGMGALTYGIFMLRFRGIKRRDLQRVPGPIKRKVIALLNK